jgi:hypothetical protein
MAVKPKFWSCQPSKKRAMTESGQNNGQSFCLVSLQKNGLNNRDGGSDNPASIVWHPRKSENWIHHLQCHIHALPIQRDLQNTIAEYF